ncbi:SDR family NAD(P)-dependent oxidoreductase [Actinoplanes sp. NPDC049265]|uniref:SDR family NAD(P)-dependent oxidoreductase n=1 Tax=Actinoplanes sp. NPDC049265 TaxID=3363902 RepID=UPI0037119BBB
MDLRLDGVRVMVTGASRGIGLATVRRLGAEGARVVAVSRTVTPELAATGARTVTADLSTADGPADAVEAALDGWGDLDVLVNNAGGGDPAALVRGHDADAVWLAMFELNLMAAVRTTRAALPSLTRTRGVVVNVSSDGARAPHRSFLPYAAMKGALNVWSQGLAREAAPKGVRVNVVTPSATRTSLLAGDNGLAAVLGRATGTDPAEVLAAVPAQNGLLTGRLIEPAEVATLIAYLASPLAASILGGNYVIDGGALSDHVA